MRGVPTTPSLSTILSPRRITRAGPNVVSKNSRRGTLVSQLYCFGCQASGHCPIIQPPRATDQTIVDYHCPRFMLLATKSASVESETLRWFSERPPIICPSHQLRGEFEEDADEEYIRLIDKINHMSLRGVKPCNPYTSSGRAARCSSTRDHGIITTAIQIPEES